MYNWQWWTNQAFALVGLVLVIISFQQKGTKKIIFVRCFATLTVFIGLCFLGNISAMIMCGAGVIRNFVTLYFAYKPQTKNLYRWIASVLICILIISLNIIFWENLYNVFSIIIGIGNVVTFMQKNPKVIRALAVVMGVLLVTYFSLLLSPTNIAIETAGLVSALVGVFRFDLAKKSK